MSDLRTWKDGPTAYFDKRAARYIRTNCDPYKNELYVYIAGSSGITW